jgi:hypothetical protein
MLQIFILFSELGMPWRDLFGVVYRHRNNSETGDIESTLGKPGLGQGFKRLEKPSI